jgi:hypothetical protein
MIEKLFFNLLSNYSDLSFLKDIKVIYRSPLDNIYLIYDLIIGMH